MYWQQQPLLLLYIPFLWLRLFGLHPSGGLGAAPNSSVDVDAYNSCHRGFNMKRSEVALRRQNDETKDSVELEDPHLRRKHVADVA